MQEERIGLVSTSHYADILGNMNELVFEVTQEEDGGFCAECLSETYSPRAITGMQCA
jgi:hypothetical protein